MIIHEFEYTKNDKLNPVKYTYTDTSLELGQPCLMQTYKYLSYDRNPLITIYPIKVKDYEEFEKYCGYLLFGKVHFNTPQESNLLKSVVENNALSKCKSIKSIDDVIEKIPYVLEEMCELIKMVTKKDVVWKVIEGEYVFFGEGITIDKDNFDTFRNIVMKMNLLKEPKYFEDKLYEKMYYQSMKANRGEATLFVDIIAIVMQDMKYTFEYISELNIFQLYALYTRITHVKTSDAITIYRTCSDKLPNISFNDGVIEKLFKEQDDSDLFADLGNIANKLS